MKLNGTLLKYKTKQNGNTPIHKNIVYSYITEAGDLACVFALLGFGILYHHSCCKKTLIIKWENRVKINVACNKYIIRFQNLQYFNL